jgi:hypothetical protein
MAKNCASDMHFPSGKAGEAGFLIRDKARHKNIFPASAFLAKPLLNPSERRGI